MPSIYRLECKACDESSMVSIRYAAFVRDSGEEIQLPHPGETGALRALGWTFEHAAAAGRLKIYSAYGCLACGEVVDLGRDSIDKPCQACGSDQVEPLTEIRKLVCPSCKKRTLRVRFAGVW